MLQPVSRLQLIASGVLTRGTNDIRNNATVQAHVELHPLHYHIHYLCQQLRRKAESSTSAFFAKSQATAPSSISAALPSSTHEPIDLVTCLYHPTLSHPSSDQCHSEPHATLSTLTSPSSLAQLQQSSVAMRTAAPQITSATSNNCSVRFLGEQTTALVGGLASSYHTPRMDLALIGTTNAVTEALCLH